MLQLLYISSAKRSDVALDLDALLAQAQANNSRDEITGLLFTEGRRFLQVLEGPEASVAATYARIAADPRHHALVLLSKRNIEQREFGEWSMARRSFADTHKDTLARISELCRGANASVLGTFVGLVEARRAA